MSVTAALKGRWHKGLDKHPTSLTAKTHFDAILKSAEKIAAAQTELAGDKTLSDIGRAEKLKAFATSEAAYVAKAARALEFGRGSIRNQRAALLPTVKDTKDVVAAMLRREQREYLRTLSPAEMTAVLADPNTPSILLESIFEAPNLVTNIPPESKQRLLDQIVERTADPIVQSLREQEEALGLLETALRVSTETVGSAAGVQPLNFNKWLATVAPKDSTEVEAEAAEINVRAFWRYAAA